MRSCIDYFYTIKGIVDFRSSSSKLLVSICILSCRYEINYQLEIFESLCEIKMRL